MAGLASPMSESDAAIVAQARAEGIACIPDLLTPDELAAARADFDVLHLDARVETRTRGREQNERTAPIRGKQRGRSGTAEALDGFHEIAGSRVFSGGDQLGTYPGLARLFMHPRVVRIVGAIMGEPLPFLQHMLADRYNIGHPGLWAHSDAGPEHAPAFERIATMIFLDDIGEPDPSLEYVPRTHIPYFLDPNSRVPSDAVLPLPVGRDTLDEIHAAHAKGRFIPVNVPAGGCVFRVPATWHAVRPVNRLRRYITGRYLARSDRPVSANAMRLIENATAERRTSAGAARLQSFPAPLRELCSPEGLMVARVPRVVPDGPRL